MNITRRELMLAGCTVGVLLVGGGYLIATPLVRRLNEAGNAAGQLAKQEMIARRLIAQRPEVEARATALRASIPRYAPGVQVGAEVLKTVKKLADQHSLALPRVEPNEEKTIGDLHEIAVDCAWEGPLEALVRFLFSVQQQGAMLDIRQLTAAPAPNAAGRLKGNFTVFFAFSREEAAVSGAP